MRKYSIAVDFDGVIHEYTTKWEKASRIPDPPMPGAFEWLGEMTKHFRVVIFSSRLTPHGNTEAAWAQVQIALENVRIWFRAHGMREEVLEKLVFWTDPGKPTALIYIDDRGFRFEGTFPTKQQIHLLRPWKVTDGAG